MTFHSRAMRPLGHTHTVSGAVDRSAASAGGCCSADGRFSALAIARGRHQQLQLHSALDVVTAQLSGPSVRAGGEPQLKAVVGVAVGAGGNGCAHHLQRHGAQRVQNVRQQAAPVHAGDAQVKHARVAALVHVHARHRAANRRRQAGKLRWRRAGGGRRSGGVGRARAAAARCSRGGFAAQARQLILLRRAAQLQAFQRVDCLLEDNKLAASPLAAVASTQAAALPCARRVARHCARGISIDACGRLLARHAPMTRSWSIMELMRSRRCFSDAPWLTLPPPSCAGPAPQSSPEPPGLWPAGCSIPAATRWLAGASYAPASCGRNCRPAVKAAGGPASPRLGRNCRPCAVGVPSAREERVSGRGQGRMRVLSTGAGGAAGACDAPNKWDLEAARGSVTLAAPGLGEPSARQKACKGQGHERSCRAEMAEERRMRRGQAAAGAWHCSGTLHARLGAALAA